MSTTVRDPAPSLGHPVRDPGRSPRWVRSVYVANLVVQAGIILTGAVVRITGSGLGCPTWPECVEGSLVPTSGQMESWHKYVEFGNRLLTFVLAIAAIAAVLAALLDRWRRRRGGLPARGVLTLLACVPLIGTVVQAVLGGVTVLTGLNPYTVSAHFLVSIALVAACVALVVRSGERGDRPIRWLVPTPLRYLTWAVVAATFAVVVLGVITTGSGPHSGDIDVQVRFDLDLRTIAWLHADSVLLFMGLTIGLLVASKVAHAPAPLMRRTTILLGIAIIQGIIGYTQWFTDLPELLVAIHVLGAIAVWIAVLFLPPTLRVRGESPAHHGGTVSVT
ncbi:MAG: COX15/CtaA family protein [Candidatus Nanopelagicales bacterium]